MESVLTLSLVPVRLPAVEVAGAVVLNGGSSTSWSAASNWVGWWRNGSGWST